MAPEFVGTRLDRIQAISARSRLRLIQRVIGTANTNAQVYRVMNSAYQEQDPFGVNGPRGWSDGSYTAQLGLEGSFTLNFPNGIGEDGLLHRNRFLILTYADYHPGDEWFEIWQDEELLFVGTPTGCVIDGSTISITGVDGWWLLNKVRETAAGIWYHGPRDVLERYCSAWASLYSNDFSAYTAANGAALWNWATTPGTSADNDWTYTRAESFQDTVRLRPSGSGALASLVLAAPPTLLNAGIGDGQRDWSVEWRFIRSPLYVTGQPGNDFNVNSSWLRFGFYNTALGTVATEIFDMTIFENTVFLRSGNPQIGTQGFRINTKVNTNPDEVSTVRFEQRDYWIYCYLNDALLGCLPNRIYDGTALLPYSTTFLYPFCFLQSATSGGDEWVVVQHISIRQATPLTQGQGAQIAQQHVNILGSPTAGTYTLSYKGQTTAAISRTTSPQAALNALAAITAEGGVTVTSSYPSWLVSWNKAGFRPIIQGNPALLTGGTNTNIAVSYLLDPALNTARTGSAVSDQGDYRLPGSYPNTGITGFYYDDADIATLTSDGGTAAYMWQQLNPSRQPYAEKVERSIFFGGNAASGGGGWEPPGPGSDISFSSRWAGAIYLDVSNSDYKLQFSGSRYRLWLGGTRYRDALIDSWFSGFTNTPVQSGWLVGTSANPGPLFGQKSGWFPLVVDYSSEGYPPQLTYQPGAFGGPTTYASGAWFIPGSILYGPLQLTRNNIQAYWPLNGGLIPPTNEVDEVSAIALADNNFTDTTAAWERGPFVGSIGLHFNLGGAGGSAYLSSAFNATLNPTNDKFSISAWIRLDTNSPAANMVIVSSGTGSTGYQFRVNSTGVLSLNVNNGNLVTGTTVLAANTWYHVAVTYDGTQARLYINGQLEAGPTTVTYTHATAGGFRIGAGGLFGTSPFTATNFFLGRIAHLAFYNTMISAANLLVDYNQQFIPDPVALSPLGIYKADIRLDSHYNQVQTVLQSFGHQMTCSPRSLESGEFPGVMAPHVRVGRDTEYVLTAAEASNFSKTVDATDVADTLLGDAQGLGTITTDTTITYEATSEADTQPAAHLFLCQDYDQQSQTSSIAMLQAYLSNVLTLRTSPWEQLNASSTGFTEAVDTFPLSGALAAFRWQPGDGIRIDIPSIQVTETTPRQITGVQWALTPTDPPTPTITFRDRPRDLYRSLRSLQQQIFNQKRNYQLQVYTVTGSVAGYGSQQPNVGGTVVSGVNGNQSRVGLPQRIADVIKAEVVLQSQAGTLTDVLIYVNSSSAGFVTTGIKAHRKGRYDVTGFLGHADGNNQYMAIRMMDTAGVAIPATAAYGGIFHLELLVKG